jgi:hypothetical protein
MTQIDLKVTPTAQNIARTLQKYYFERLEYCIILHNISASLQQHSYPMRTSTLNPR